VSGYNVYRQAESGLAYNKLNPTPVTQNRYVDTDTEINRLYHYRVTAVSSSGLEGTHTAITANTARARGKTKNFEF
jgi:fibronectin type 3 domain-containing protein